MGRRENERYDRGRSSFVAIAESRVILKGDTLSKRLVNRAALGNLSKAFALSVIEVPLDMDVTGDLFNQSFFGVVTILAIICMNPIKIVTGTDGLQCHVLVFAIPGDRYAGASGQGSEQEFIGIWSGIGAAGTHGLVALPCVPAVTEMYDHSRGKFSGYVGHDFLQACVEATLFRRSQLREFGLRIAA